MYTQILVPLDGSEIAEKAIPHAQGLAKTYGATVHLLQVFRHHPSGGHPRGNGPDGGGTVGLRAGLAGGIPTGLASWRARRPFRRLSQLTVAPSPNRKPRWR